MRHGRSGPPPPASARARPSPPRAAPARGTAARARAARWASHTPRRPWSCERGPGLLREHVGEAGARLLRPDDDDVPRDAAANVPVEVGGDVSEVIAGELVDVSLEACLRPATLVVTSGLLLGQIRERLEPSVHELEEQTALAVDDGDDRSLAAAEQRNERPEVEVGADAHAVRHRLAQGVDAPELVEPRGEDGDALRAGAVEVVREEVADRSKSDCSPAFWSCVSSPRSANVDFCASSQPRRECRDHVRLGRHAVREHRRDQLVAVELSAVIRTRRAVSAICGGPAASRWGAALT